MDAVASTLGFRRRIGYSIGGVLAGDFLLLILVSLITKAWDHPDSHFWSLPFFILYCSLFGWMVVGIPAMLLINTAAVARLKWYLEVTVGALLGFVAMMVIFAIFGEHLPTHSWSWAYFWIFAALVSTVAFSIYSALVRGALQQQERDSALAAKDEPLQMLRPLARIDMDSPEPPACASISRPPNEINDPEFSLDNYKSERPLKIKNLEPPLDIYKAEWLNTLQPTDPRRRTSEVSRPPGSKPS